MSSETSDRQQVTQWWQHVANRYAGVVWSAIRGAGLPEHAAVDVNRLTWMRFADHVDEVEPNRIESWLCQTALRECRRSARLLGLAPEPDTE